MQADIHPKWYPNAKMSCACGHAFTVGSTQEEIRVEVCSACHPFYTGQQKFVDTLGRVERFQAKQKAVSATKQVSKKKRQALKKAAEDKAEAARPKSLKEMFQRENKQP